MLNSIPGLIYLAPVTKEDYIAMLDWSLKQNEYPVAIKVPGGRMVSTGTPVTKDFSKLGTYEVTKKGSRVAILGLGTFYETAVKAADILKASHGIDATVINPYYISGIDADTLNELKKDHAVVATLEDGYLEGNGYLVSWCVGHLVELAPPNVYDAKYTKWSIADLPILPQKWQYLVSASTKKQFGILQKLMHRPDVKSIVNSCDAG